MGTGEADDVVSGRSHDRHRAVLMAATGQLRGRLRAEFHGRRQTVSSMLSLIDPYPTPDRRSALTKDTYMTIERGRDAAETERRRALLLAFGDALLQATWMLTKNRYRKRFKGHYAIDGSSFTTFAKGSKKRGHIHSVEPDAGWYRRQVG